MASTSRSGETAAGSYATVASFIIRFTVASVTPGSFWRVRCTRAWQAAQVMPVTGIRIVVVIATSPSPVARAPRAPSCHLRHLVAHVFDGVRELLARGLGGIEMNGRRPDLHVGI